MTKTTEIIAEGFKGERAIVTPYNIRTYLSNNPITKQLYITHIGYYPKAKHHQRNRLEGTPEHILIYCTSGKGWIEHRDEIHTLERNQAYIIPANEANKYGADWRDPWSIYWIHFKGDNISFYESIYNKVIVIGDTDSSRQQDRIRLFNEMYENLEMGYSPENLEYISLSFVYFLATLKYLSQYREVSKIKIEDVIQISIKYMKDNLENKITLDDIAKAISYSKSHFITIFTQKTSYPPMVYYNQLRIQRACTYLQFSNLKIKEIAFRLNFYDPFHFSKAFLKEMEISPKEYRKRYHADFQDNKNAK